MQNRIFLSSQELSRREISLKTMGRIYEALIRTILLYGCETWPVLVEDLRRLEVSDNDCLWCLLRCYRRDRIPAHTSVKAAVSMHYLRASFDAAYAGLDTLQTGPR